MQLPPATMLNKVARSTVLSTRAGTILFAMNQKQLDCALAAQARALAQARIDPAVIRAYQAIGPLLMEREAIGTFLSQTENSGLNGALREIHNPAEAVSIAAAEFSLGEPQRIELLKLLNRLL